MNRAHRPIHLDLPGSAEVERRLVHGAGTLIPVIYLVGLVTWRQLRWIVGIGLIVALLLEAIRLLVGLDWVVFDRLTRGYEESNLAGYALYLIGIAVVAIGFSPSIAVPAILMLTIGDPIVGLLGSNELRTVKRPLALASMFVISFLLAVPFVTVIAAVVGGTVAMMADGIKPVIAGHVIDDNLTIPIGTAIAMYATQTIGFAGF